MGIQTNHCYEEFVYYHFLAKRLLHIVFLESQQHFILSKVGDETLLLSELLIMVFHHEGLHQNSRRDLGTEKFYGFS